MIGIDQSTRVMVATRPVHFRKGPDSLAALVAAEYGGDPYSGVIYVFPAKRDNYLKALHWDGSCMCLFAKRLERHRFVWPPLVDGGVVLTPAQVALLIEAMDWRRTIAPEVPRIPVQI